MVIACSLLTYLASAIRLLGGVPIRVLFWPKVLTQGSDPTPCAPLGFPWACGAIAASS
ncbi:MAG TPA: hypothetical protein VE864_14980 [Streptosporangiaceae bacterium]|nr:hypothetical protein [Streptosporangiaceae bacterium]